MIDGRGDRLPLFGLVPAYLGFSIWDPSRTIVTAVVAAPLTVLWFLHVRDARLARRFLDRHPAPEGTSA